MRVIGNASLARTVLASTARRPSLFITLINQIRVVVRLSLIFAGEGARVPSETR